MVLCWPQRRWSANHYRSPLQARFPDLAALGGLALVRLARAVRGQAAGVPVKRRTGVGCFARSRNFFGSSPSSPVLAPMTQASRGPLGKISGLLQLPCDCRDVTSQDDDARDHDQQRSHLARDPCRAAGEFFIQPEVRKADRNDRIARCVLTEPVLRPKISAAPASLKSATGAATAPAAAAAAAGGSPAPVRPRLDRPCPGRAGRR